MRLIDADVLKEEMDMAWHPDMEVSEIWNVIDNAPTVDGWTSVKEDLPEVGVKCFIRDKTDVTIGKLIDKEQRIWQWEDSDFYGKGGITHWMAAL